MNLSTRGKYNDTLVFTCPNCSLENYASAYLHSQYQGKTGMDRIKECGFNWVVFKGARGIQEIVEQVR